MKGYFGPLLLFLALLFYSSSPISNAAKLGSTCVADRNCDAGLHCETCIAGGSARPRCTRIRPSDPKSKGANLPFNRYSWLTTHNSFAKLGQNSQTGTPVLAPANQQDTVTGQFSWKDRIVFTLGCMEIDLSLHEEMPILTESSTSEEKKLYEKWERSNCLSHLLMQSNISIKIKSSISDSKTAKEFLTAVKEQFASSDKAFASTMISGFTSLKYNGSSGIREHIMELRDIAAQLKTLEVDMSETFLIHFVLNSLPSEYAPFKI